MELGWQLEVRTDHIADTASPKLQGGAVGEGEGGGERTDAASGLMASGYGRFIYRYYVLPLTNLRLDCHRSAHEEQISFTAPRSRKTPTSVRDDLPRSKCTTDILQ